MTITVAEVLKCKTLDGAKVLAGKKSLEREVTSVTVGEVPDIANWLRGGEVVLSTFFATSSSTSERIEFVKRIIEHKASALLAKPKRFVGEVDPEIVSLADKKNFPLIEVPTEVRWTEIIKEIYERIISLETEIRLKGDFVDDLITGQFVSDEALISRARFLGFDISNGAQIIIADIDNFSDYVAKRNLSEYSIQRTKREFFNYVSQIVQAGYANALLSLKGDKIIVFLGPKAELNLQTSGQAKKLAEGIKNGCRKHFDFTVSLGVGRFYSQPAELDKTYNEANVALQISRRLGETGNIIFFEKVGTHKLLFNLLRVDSEELRNFYEETVGVLASYDLKNHTELVETLTSYLKNNQNVNETAASLFSHRHTIRYRLQRMKEITGLDPFNVEDLEQLSIGLKVMHFFKL